MDISPIPCLSDNYSYLLHCKKTNKAAVVDPVEPDKVLSAVRQAGAELVAVLTTHHHPDHAGGNAEMVKRNPGIKVYGADTRIPGLNEVVTHNAEFKIGSLHVKSLFTPCHTTGSTSFYVVNDEEKVVFTGDTLFIGGCGRFFEGTANDMHHALCEILAILPPETKVYPGHEYTMANYKFALTIEPENEELKKKALWASSVDCTVPSAIGDELKTNPFMRVNVPAVQAATHKKDPVEVMHALRNMKNAFK